MGLVQQVGIDTDGGGGGGVAQSFPDKEKALCAAMTHRELSSFSIFYPLDGTAIRSATRIPSTAALMMPPAQPPPSPQG